MYCEKIFFITHIQELLFKTLQTLLKMSLVIFLKNLLMVAILVISLINVSTEFPSFTYGPIDVFKNRGKYMFLYVKVVLFIKFE